MSPDLESRILGEVSKRATSVSTEALIAELMKSNALDRGEEDEFYLSLSHLIEDHKLTFDLTYKLRALQTTA